VRRKAGVIARRLRAKELVLGLVLLGGCITRAEYREGVKARRTYYDATKWDLRNVYDSIPEPSRSTRKRLVDDEEESIQAAEIRAGIRDATGAIIAQGS